jgi:hypothetical protein
MIRRPETHPEENTVDPVAIIIILAIGAVAGWLVRSSKVAGLE